MSGMRATPEGPSLFPAPPSILYADDGEWRYYIHGHDPEKLWAIDNPEELLHEFLWLHPVRASDVDESDRPEDYETVTRGPDGRFASTYVWFECREDSPGAEPYMGVRYAPV